MRIYLKNNPAKFQVSLVISVKSYCDQSKTDGLVFKTTLYISLLILMLSPCVLVTSIKEVMLISLDQL